MKKFIKFKIDNSEVTNRTSPSAVPDPPPGPNLSSKVARMNSEVQSPLPLDPPPDTLSSSQRTMVSQIRMEKLKKHICRDFIRGTCKRQENCRFAHKYDLSQLAGVYTFCHKYQNSVCTYANCKYVHASVFEERNFYRTGILPPHALAHHRRFYVLQPPPPPPPIPPPPPPPEEPPAVQLITFSYPPPPIPNELRLEQPILSCDPVNSIETRSFSDRVILRSMCPIKRSWKTSEEYGVRRFS